MLWFWRSRFCDTLTFVRVNSCLSLTYRTALDRSDPRIREITQGDAFTDALPTAAFYTKYVIQHVVPRYNNPSSVHDDDQYNLCIYVPSGVVAAGLETFMEEWLVAAGNPLGATLAADGIESFDHVACPVTAI